MRHVACHHNIMNWYNSTCIFTTWLSWWSWLTWILRNFMSSRQYNNTRGRHALQIKLHKWETEARPRQKLFVRQWHHSAPIYKYNIANPASLQDLEILINALASAAASAISDSLSSCSLTTLTSTIVTFYVFLWEE